MIHRKARRRGTSCRFLGGGVFSPRHCVRCCEDIRELSVGRVARTVDLDANGRTDLLQSWSDGKGQRAYTAFLAQGAAPDLVSLITNGSGATTALSYLPMSDPTVYQPVPPGGAADFIALDVCPTFARRRMVRSPAQ